MRTAQSLYGVTLTQYTCFIIQHFCAECKCFYTNFRLLRETNAGKENQEHTDTPHAPEIFLWFDYARSTLPERRQRVHTFIFLGVPLTMTLTRCTLGAQIRLVFLLEWLTRLPLIAPLPHTSQNLPISLHLLAESAVYEVECD